MKKFKDIYIEENKIVEGLEYTSLFGFVKDIKRPHKIFESLETRNEDEIDLFNENVYLDYLEILDRTFLNEADTNNEENNDEENVKQDSPKQFDYEGHYKRKRQWAINNGKSYKDYYINKSLKPYDGVESRMNRNANLTELLPCIWKKMYYGLPINVNNIEPDANKLFKDFSEDDISSISKPQNLPRYDMYTQTDSSVIREVMIKTLEYVKTHSDELKDVVKYGNSRYSSLSKYDDNSVSPIYMALKQDLLLALDITTYNYGRHDIDYNLAIKSVDANVITKTVTYKNSKGYDVEKVYIDRANENMFTIKDLSHNRNFSQLSEIASLTSTIRNKCLQAFNIYNMLSKKIPYKKLGATRRSDVTLYWTCSNTNKGDFDVDYTDTTSDIIAKSSEGKSIGISLKAYNKPTTFNAKNYNIQSLIANMMDFNKEEFDSMVKTMLGELWEIQGYRNLINKNAIDKISKEDFIKYKGRTLEASDNSVKYEYIDKWNNLFNDAIFEPIMDEMIEEFPELSKSNENIEVETIKRLAKKVKNRCTYIYTNSYLGVYDEFMSKACNIFTEFTKRMWSKTYEDGSNNRKKFVDNMFGEREGKDVMLLVGGNSYKDSVDVTLYNDYLKFKLMNNPNSYPIFTYTDRAIEISFNGLDKDKYDNDFHITIDLEKRPDGNLMSNEKEKHYFFAFKDYFEHYVEKITYKLKDTDEERQKYTNDVYPYKVFKKSLGNRYTSDTLLTPIQKMNIEKCCNEIKDSIGKMSKVVNFPFNSSATVILDIRKLKKRLDRGAKND